MKEIKHHTLTQLHATDAEQLHRFIMENKERLMYYFPVTLSLNATLEKTKVYIATKANEIVTKVNYTFAIRNEVSNSIDGLMIIKKIDWDNKIGELAYCIGSNQEGKGLTSFAVKEMTAFAFDDLGLKTLQIIAHKTNVGSVRVAEKSGFVWQKTLKDEFTPINEAPLDMELFELYNRR